MRDSDRGGGRRLVVWVCATAIFAASVGGIAAFESAVFSAPPPSTSRTTRAGRGRAKSSRRRGAETSDGGEKAAAERATEVVPGPRSSAASSTLAASPDRGPRGRGRHRRGTRRSRPRRRPPDLGMKLDAPGGVADEERLRAPGVRAITVAHAAAAHLVAVPLGGIRPVARAARSADRQRRRRSPRPRTSRSRSPPGARRRPRPRELRPAQTPSRAAALEHLGQQRRLLADPGRVPLVDVHRAAEGHHRS